MPAEDRTDTEAFDVTGTVATVAVVENCSAQAQSLCEHASATARVVDDLPDFIPISPKELGAIETFLGDLIDILVKS